MFYHPTSRLYTLSEIRILSYYSQDIDRKNEQTAAILKMQGAQLAELEALYKEEQVLRKRYFNTIEGNCVVSLSLSLLL